MRRDVSKTSSHKYRVRCNIFKDGVRVLTVALYLLNNVLESFSDKCQKLHQGTLVKLFDRNIINHIFPDPAVHVHYFFRNFQAPTLQAKSYQAWKKLQFG